MFFLILLSTNGCDCYYIEYMQSAISFTFFIHKTYFKLYSFWWEWIRVDYLHNFMRFSTVTDKAAL